MVSVSFIVCFIRARVGHLPVDKLKTCLLDLYSPRSQEAVYIGHSEPSVHLSGFPHIPDRRDGESHAAGIGDDIFVGMTYLDEQRNLDVLSIYVSTYLRQS